MRWNFKRRGRPFTVAYGMGVDSTAILVGLIRLCQEGQAPCRPDLITFADTRCEKDQTYAYLPIINKVLVRNGFPEVTVVENKVTNFKNYPPYRGLEENCLTNGTLPSLAFGGRKSCSQKWKVRPQDKFVEAWTPAVRAWRKGKRVIKAIGFDCGERYRTFAVDPSDDRYDYIYPLQEWGWDRQRCKQEIAAAGLPTPEKSSCFFCPAMKPDEVRRLPKDKLRRIVVMEARAAPRLEKIKGLWGNGRKGMRGSIKRPGRMTDLIREEGLLPVREIAYLQKSVPRQLIRYQDAYRKGRKIPSWEEFFASLNIVD